MNGGITMGDVNAIIGNKLKELRKGKLTQEQLARYLEVDQSFITKIENGTRSLNVTLIEKICNLFGCTEEYLVGESEEYIPLNFAFRSNAIQIEDLESIAAINKIAMNLRFMNEVMGDE
jgi:transcriptional regulator with XRE-family HTH domain